VSTTIVVLYLDYVIHFATNAPIGDGGWAPKIACTRLVALLALEVIGTTNFGIAQARTIRTGAVSQARLAVNLSEVSPDERSCYESVIVYGGLLPPYLATQVEATDLGRRQTGQAEHVQSGLRRSVPRRGPALRPGMCQSVLTWRGYRSGQDTGGHDAARLARVARRQMQRAVEFEKRELEELRGTLRG